MAMRRIDRLVLGVHDASPPTDAEWERWIALCRDQPGPLRVLVDTYGGGPNPKQRKALSDALSARDLRSGILTDSLLVRGLVTALAWLGIALRAFPRGDYAEAGAYLQLSASELSVCRDVLTQLRDECGTREARTSA